MAISLHVGAADSASAIEVVSVSLGAALGDALDLGACRLQVNGFCYKEIYLKNLFFTYHSTSCLGFQSYYSPWQARLALSVPKW